jgi:hypothetical protein
MERAPLTDKGNVIAQFIGVSPRRPGIGDAVSPYGPGW